MEQIAKGRELKAKSKELRARNLERGVEKPDYQQFRIITISNLTV